MSFFGSFYTSLAGLDAQTKRLNAVGQNLTNANSVGYRQREVDFVTVLAETNRPVGAAQSVRAIERIRPEEGGVVTPTTNDFDVAIAGNGFFVVNTNADGTGDQLLTRNGSFRPDRDGFLRNSAGYYAMGYPVTNATADTTVTGAPQVLQFDPTETLVPGQTTTAVNYRATLPGADPTTAQDTVGLAFADGSRTNPLTLTWTPVPDVPNAWDLSFSTLGGEGTVTAPATPVRFTFDQNGQLIQPTGGTAVTVDWNAYTDPISGEVVTPGSLTTTFDFTGTSQGGQDFTVLNANQNGFAAGRVSRVGFFDDGVLAASSSAGVLQSTFKLAIGEVRAPDELFERSGSAFEATDTSGAITFSASNNNGAGRIVTQAVELANVDQVDSFSQMIEAQRAYTFSATALRTVDEMIQTATQVKR